MNQPALKETETEETWVEEKPIEKKIVNLSGLNTAEKIIEALRSSEGEKPGRFLKQLRELEGLSINQMATDIGLSTHQIVSLEDDDDANLPAVIYVKGFIKRYCHALGVPSEEIIAAYDRSHLAEDTVPALNRVSIKKKIHSDAAVMRWVGYALGIGFVALVIFWLQSVDFGGLLNSTTTTAVDQPAELNLPVLEQPGADIAEPEKAE